MSKILIIDDEEDICDLLKDIMEDLGHEVRVAKDGLEGLSTMIDFKPHVVFLDRRMPGMNGENVLKKMHEDNIKSHVIVTTADVDDKIHKEFESLGAIGILTKPFDVLNIKKQLVKMLPLVFHD